MLYAYASKAQGFGASGFRVFGSTGPWGPQTFEVLGFWAQGLGSFMVLGVVGVGIRVLLSGI